MKLAEESEMHRLATALAKVTEGTGWEASRYWAICQIMQQLAEYCPTCPCQEKK